MEYQRLRRTIKRITDSKNLTKQDRESLKELKARLQKTPSVIRDENTGKRVYYNRYADDWVVGACGPIELVNTIKDKIDSFLTGVLELELSQDKTKITNLLRDKAQFLGFDFQIRRPKESTFSVSRVGNHIRKRKSPHNRIWLLVPVVKILNKLASEGFLKNYVPGKPITTSAKTAWIFLSHRDICSRYNMLTRGLLNYYSIATNRYVFNLIVNYILKHSCAKTLARKFNLGSRKKAFAKFGINLSTANRYS